MLAQFNDVGSLGLITDTDVYDLPADKDNFAWSSGQNVRFQDNYVLKSKGYSSVFGTPSITPYYMLPVPQASTYFWLYPGLDKVYVHDGSTHSNVTRQTASVDVDYTGAVGNRWVGGVINSIPVITNGVDDPQMWNPAAASQRLTSLTHSAGQTWASQNWTAKVIRPFRQYLMALDVTKSGTRFEHLIHWSTQAQSAAVPSTWDDTDATEDAGFADLSETPGVLIDCLPLGRANIVYKEDSIWLQQYIGGNDIFNFSTAFKGIGALSSHCVQNFFGRHIVLGQNDIYVHDGQSIESVIEKRVKDTLFNSIDSANYGNSFVAANHRDKEMWICYPTTGNTLANRAVIWNYHDNTYAFRDLPNTPYISYGVVDPSELLTWNPDTDTWNTDTTNWNERTFNPSINRLCMASGSNFFLMDDTDQANGVNETAYIERSGLAFGDTTQRKLIKRIWPRFTSNGPVTVRVGCQDYRNGPITWVNNSFDPSTDDKVDVLVDGRYIAIRFESTTNINWKLHSFSMDFDYSGRF